MKNRAILNDYNHKLTHNRHTALGGNIFGLVGVGLSGKLPFELGREWGARWCLFSQAGSLGDRINKVTNAENVKVNVGAGIHVPSPYGQVEITTTKVVKSKEGDVKYNGWFPQIGINFEIGG